MQSHKITNQIIHYPSVPLPLPICGADQQGSWANTTIAKRLPDIARLCIAENNYDEKINKQLRQLIVDIISGKIRTLHDDASTDYRVWEDLITRYIGSTWMEVPWIFAEFYFYRRILEATGYYTQADNYFKDPFMQQKTQGLRSSEMAILNLCAILRQIEEQSELSISYLQRFLYLALWGNQVDLSIWHAGQQKARKSNRLTYDSKNLVIDESTQLLNYIFDIKQCIKRIDYIADNAGMELVFDLALIYYLLRTNSSLVIHLHLKPTPVFVSDAMQEDFKKAIELLIHFDNKVISNLGIKLLEFTHNGRLVVFDDPFWSLPLAFWEFPDELFNKIAQSDLLIIKGDANYRRLLGDRRWEFSTSVRDIVNYLPVPVLAMRVFKSELAVGISRSKFIALNSFDPDWMTNGKWGMIQFVRNKSLTNI